MTLVGRVFPCLILVAQCSSFAPVSFNGRQLHYHPDRNAHTACSRWRPCLHVMRSAQNSSGTSQSRRKVVQTAGGFFIATGIGGTVQHAAAELPGTKSVDFLEVPVNELDAGAAAVLEQEESIWESIQQRKEDAVFSFRGGKLLKTNSEGALRYLARRSAVFMGETHNHPEDKALALSILKALYRRRNGQVALGLEMVQKPFQPVLDWYVFKAKPSKSSDRALYEETEWEQRWFWSFANYLPLLRFCQLNKVPLVALNVRAETTAKVRQRGLTSLSPDEREDLVMDARGFRADSLAPTFPDYVQAVMRPSFDAHVRMGIFQGDDDTFRNFVSNRILWDEAMASTATRYMMTNPQRQLLGLVGGDHVKTGHGIPSRLERILASMDVPTRVASVSLNPSWQLYSQGRRILNLQKEEALRSAPPSNPAPSESAVARKSPAMETSDEQQLEFVASARQGSTGAEQWQSPPPAVQNPFSDIVWFS